MSADVKTPAPYAALEDALRSARAQLDAFTAGREAKTGDANPYFDDDPRGLLWRGGYKSVSRDYRVDTTEPPPLASLLDKLILSAARLALHTDKIDPPFLQPPPSRVWVTFSRSAGGGHPLATHCVDLDDKGEGVLAALGSIDLFLALRVRR